MNYRAAIAVWILAIVCGGSAWGQSYLELVEQLETSEEPAAKVPILKRMLDHPDAPERSRPTLLASLGFCHLYGEELEEARDAFAASVDLAPHEYQNQFTLAQIHERLEDLDLARTHYELAYREKRGDLASGMRLVLIDANAGALHEARVRLAELGEAHPGAASVPAVLARVALAEQQIGEAWHHADRALAIDPDSKVALMDRDLIEDQLSAEQLAVVVAHAATYADPTDVARWLRYGALAEDLGDYASSADAFDEVVALRPDHADARLRAAVNMLHLGFGASAAARLRILVDRRPERLLDGLLRHRVLTALGQPEVATRVLSEQLAQAPEAARDTWHARLAAHVLRGTPLSEDTVIALTPLQTLELAYFTWARDRGSSDVDSSGVEPQNAASPNAPVPAKLVTAAKDPAEGAPLRSPILGWIRRDVQGPVPALPGRIQDWIDMVPDGSRVLLPATKFVTGQGPSLHLEGRSDLTLVGATKGLPFEGSAPATEIASNWHQSMITLVRCQNIAFERVVIRRYPFEGLEDRGTGLHAFETSGLRVTDCVFHTGAEGIYVRESKSVEITDSLLTHFRSAAIQLEGVQGVTVKDNRFQKVENLWRTERVTGDVKTSGNRFDGISWPLTVD